MVSSNKSASFPAPKGMKELLVRAGDAPTFAALELRLKDTLASVESLFEALVV